MAHDPIISENLSTIAEAPTLGESVDPQLGEDIMSRYAHLLGRYGLASDTASAIPNMGAIVGEITDAPPREKIEVFRQWKTVYGEELPREILRRVQRDRVFGEGLGVALLDIYSSAESTSRVNLAEILKAGDWEPPEGVKGPSVSDMSTALSENTFYKKYRSAWASLGMLGPLDSAMSKYALYLSYNDGNIAANTDKNKLAVAKAVNALPHFFVPMEVFGVHTLVPSDTISKRSESFSGLRHFMGLSNDFGGLPQTIDAMEQAFEVAIDRVPRQDEVTGFWDTLGVSWEQTKHALRYGIEKNYLTGPMLDQRASAGYSLSYEGYTAFGGYPFPESPSEIENALKKGHFSLEYSGGYLIPFIIGSDGSTKRPLVKDGEYGQEVLAVSMSALGVIASSFHDASGPQAFIHTSSIKKRGGAMPFEVGSSIPLNRGVFVKEKKQRHPAFPEDRPHPSYEAEQEAGWSLLYSDFTSDRE
jgi:hypothetical protein